MTDEEVQAAKRARLKKYRMYALIAGVTLALCCKALPHDYQAPCAAIAKLCTGGF